MYSNILIPVSFEAGRDAHQAIEMANIMCEQDGKITILHVLEHLPQYASDLLPEDHVEVAKQTIIEKLERLVADASNIDIEVVEGHSARTILDYTQSHKNDCIVITSHRPGMQDLFIGSTAARVVRHAQCSVHVIR
ncbi:universal stress protein [Cohaesibacter gelatinilyticus]|uniref:Nucleotide-binding universal stress protein, UspA family n=1 Tax=Cohaesibacter gelatinilyticus TaxID=372072 RepID=A0A285PIS5_9HYPH|nr:universal stress protein [Cohaesibacter gelatinilyticus]SNZ21640.1 Nucleotide-binding universal stress protein, UspA family [Cohaesibacter gelatinilyticus]